MRCGSSSRWSRRVPAVRRRCRSRRTPPAGRRSRRSSGDGCSRPDATRRSGSRSPWSATSAAATRSRWRGRNCLSAPKFHLRMSICALGLLARQPEEEMAERFALALFVGVERDARVEVPADDEDALLRRLHRGGDDAVIIGRIDDHRWPCRRARSASNCAPARRSAVNAPALCRSPSVTTCSTSGRSATSTFAVTDA